MRFSWFLWIYLASHLTYGHGQFMPIDPEIRDPSSAAVLAVERDKRGLDVGIILRNIWQKSASLSSFKTTSTTTTTTTTTTPASVRRNQNRGGPIPQRAPFPFDKYGLPILPFFPPNYPNGGPIAPLAVQIPRSRRPQPVVASAKPRVGPGRGSPNFVYFNPNQPSAPGNLNRPTVRTGTATRAPTTTTTTTVAPASSNSDTETQNNGTNPPSRNSLIYQYAQQDDTSSDGDTYDYYDRAGDDGDVQYQDDTSLNQNPIPANNVDYINNRKNANYNYNNNFQPSLAAPYDVSRTRAPHSKPRLLQPKQEIEFIPLQSTGTATADGYGYNRFNPSQTNPPLTYDYNGVGTDGVVPPPRSQFNGYPHSFYGL